jgi:NAD(P)-dependent dehydrogenase (short-subunit alcohol dehydrogenase family)
VRALITGGRGGLGQAFAAALSDADVTLLDLPEFDVGSPAAWRALEGEFDAAFLNAGVVTGESEISELTEEQYRRAVGANLDGVVYGTRELAARLMPNGGSIVATASLAGLTAVPLDSIYAATKHAVVGFVRSVAPQLEARGIRINALCPGFTDTPIVAQEVRGSLPAPLMEPSFVAEAALQALNDAESGGAWVVQPNRIVRFGFPRLPGPRPRSAGGGG